MQSTKRLATALSGLAGLLATAAASHGALIAYWNMDEASGNITDQVAGIVGTASAAGLTYGQSSVPEGVYGSITIPLSVATSFGQAIAFERANTGHFSVGSPASIAGLAPGGSNGSFTVMAWVNASIGSSSNHRIFSTGLPNGWGVGLSNVDQVIFTAFGIADLRSANAPSSNNQWQHLAYTYLDGDIEVFVNGDSVYTATSAIDAPTQSDFRIGGNSNGTDSFNGLIDELKIFNTALSRDDIIIQASIPEPSATLLVLPALALLIRRQRAGVSSF